MSSRQRRPEAPPAIPPPTAAAPTGAAAFIIPKAEHTVLLARFFSLRGAREIAAASTTVVDELDRVLQEEILKVQVSLGVPMEGYDLDIDAGAFVPQPPKPIGAATLAGGPHIEIARA